MWKGFRVNVRGRLTGHLEQGSSSGNPGKGWDGLQANKLDPVTFSIVHP